MCPTTLGVLAAWDGRNTRRKPDRPNRPELRRSTPPALGMRVMMPPTSPRAAAGLGAELAEAAEYDAHRIALGVPQGGVDFAYSDAFPHETDMDQLGGVDFEKGCYIGQEVVSRMQHRGTARTRAVPVRYDGAAPEAGTTVTAGDRPVGTIGSASGGHGVALLAPRPRGRSPLRGQYDFRRRGADPSRQAGLGAIPIPRRSQRSC